MILRVSANVTLCSEFLFLIKKRVCEFFACHLRSDCVRQCSSIVSVGVTYFW